MDATLTWHLIAALLAIVILILSISRFKVHPFVAILSVSIALGAVCGMPMRDLVHSFEAGVGNTLGHTAVVIALGCILGKMLAESGGADRIAYTMIRFFGAKRITWAMLMIGLLVGLPVFFEVGFVLLFPIAVTVARRTKVSLVQVTLPMIAGLSVVHALIPPHPAAIATVTAYHAELGRTILYSLLVGIPAAILAGPLYAKFIVPRLSLETANPIAEEMAERAERIPMPSFAVSVGTILLPVVLMLVGGWADHISVAGTRVNELLHLVGTGSMALLIGVVVSFATLGAARGLKSADILRFSSESLPPVAGALLLIGAGGGFGRTLQDSQVASALMTVAGHAHVPMLVSAWMFAALIRIGTGSSTVAMTTAAGIVAPVALQTAGVRPELLAIATGAGSIILSHVNDGGFWLIKEYLNLSVPQTFATWSACETIISIAGLVFVLCIAAM